ncbi:MAG: hypothetical protein D6690_12435 [Nitrospirae bacterium]|nr:MAG: hypothetical protein D6690_12435 [Nitrospirota bacterium]
MIQTWGIAIGLVMLTVSGIQNARAEQVVRVVDDAPQDVAVSTTGVTVFRFPVPVGKVFSSLTQVPIQVEGTHVVIAKVEQPGDLVVLSRDGQTAYTFRLTPTSTTAETVTVLDERQKAPPAPEEDVIVKQAPDFINQLVELTKWFGNNQVPRGYVAQSEDEARAMVPEWVGLAVEDVALYRGPAYTVLRVSLRNTTEQVHTLQNWEWNGQDVLGVALNRDRLPPGQRATVVIIRATVKDPGGEQTGKDREEEHGA